MRWPRLPSPSGARLSTKSLPDPECPQPIVFWALLDREDPLRKCSDEGLPRMIWRVSEVET
jgi:hypothetical protein